MSLHSIACKDYFLTIVHIVGKGTMISTMFTQFIQTIKDKASKQVRLIHMTVSMIAHAALVAVGMDVSKMSNLTISF